MKYICDMHEWGYDEELDTPDINIEPDSEFEDLSEDFKCSLCFVEKD